MNLNVVIAAGGTGGHISPGIAILELLVSQKENYSIQSIYIHTLKRNQNTPDFQNSNFNILFHNSPPFSGNKILFPFLFLKNLISCFLTFKKLKINTIIAMGGYSSLPAILYGIIFKKKIYLCEQNCIPGKVTRFFLKFANKVAFSFPPSIDVPKSVNYKILGNPIRKRVLPNPKYDLNKKLNSKKLNILAMGGSQGARQINNMVSDLLAEENIRKSFNFRIITGETLYEETTTKIGKKAELIAYSNDMKSHFEWAHVVIARSGAGVIAECSLYGIFLVLVPYPFAADNHQEANAKYFEKHGAKVLYQKNEEITDLREVLISMNNNRKAFQMNCENIKQLGKENATQETINYFLK